VVKPFLAQRRRHARGVLKAMDMGDVPMAERGECLRFALDMPPLPRRLRIS
jgi:hypothetical protein